MRSLRALRNSTPVNAVRHECPVLLGVALGVRAILEECSRVRSSKPEVHRQELYGHAKESHKLYAEGMFAARRACEVEESKSVHLIGRRKVGQCASRDTAVIAADLLGHHSVSSCCPERSCALKHAAIRVGV